MKTIGSALLGILAIALLAISLWDDWTHLLSPAGLRGVLLALGMLVALVVLGVCVRIYERITGRRV